MVASTANKNAYQAIEKITRTVVRKGKYSPYSPIIPFIGKSGVQADKHMQHNNPKNDVLAWLRVVLDILILDFIEMLF